MTRPQTFIVRRTLIDGHHSRRDGVHYIEVTNPNPGETIYHGQFKPSRVEIADNGPMGSTYADVMIPVDPASITSEQY